MLAAKDSAAVDAVAASESRFILSPRIGGRTSISYEFWPILMSLVAPKIESVRESDMNSATREPLGNSFSALTLSM